jgi:ketosteroid isomerase-like protein
MDNAAYRAYFGANIALFRNFHLTVTDLVVDETGDEGSADIWASSTADTPIGPYANEYVLQLRFRGDRLVRVLEFVDSHGSVGFFGRMQKWVTAQAAEGGEKAEKEDKEDKAGL